MKRFIDTLVNIWKIKTLRNRILFTLGILFIFRIGSYVVLPGVIPGALSGGGNNFGAPKDLVSLINVFTGGAFSQASIFALGIMPYITASIIIQLLGFAVPYFQRMQKDGESGRRKLNQITRLLTLAIVAVQGGGYLTYIASQGAISPDVSKAIFWVSNLIILAAGTVFCMWMGERITDKGIGNGVSLLITAGILAQLIPALAFEFSSQLESNILLFVFEMAALFAIILFNIMIVQAVRRIPVQFAKHMLGKTSTGMPTTTVQRDFIPLKLNASGVMPIIFAQALMFLPATISQFLSGSDATPSAWVRALNDFTSAPYNIVYFILVVVFTYVYTALMVNPRQYSEYLKRQNAFIPGVKPGKDTEDYIDSLTSLITLPGAIALAFIAIIPAFAVAFGVNANFATFFGGTSVLIMVGVVLDTLQQIETYLLDRKYDGLIKSGKIQGRSRMQGIGADM